MTAGLIDIGVNLTSSRFDDDREAVLAAALGGETPPLAALIITGTSLAESRAAVALCDQYGQHYPQQLSATAGIHPHSASDYSSGSVAELAELARHPSVVAIGETGLDFNRNFSPPESQQRSFVGHIELAAETGLPLFLHERDASARLLDILSQHRDHYRGGVLHCFTGDKKALYGYLDLDLYIGITGWVCDERRGLELQRLVREIPAERLLLESDAPYLLPRTLRPKPKQGRNQPCYLTEVLTTVAALRGDRADQLAATTAANSRRLFELPAAP